MKPLLFTLSLLLANASIGNDTNVYICVSKNAKVYHIDKDCHGLARCTHEVRKVTLSEIAERSRSGQDKQKHRLCGYED